MHKPWDPAYKSRHGFYKLVHFPSISCFYFTCANENRRTMHLAGVTETGNSIPDSEHLRAIVLMSGVKVVYGSVRKKQLLNFRKKNRDISSVNK